MVEAQSEQLAYSIQESARLTGVGRSTIYEELATGRLRARKLGRRTIITLEDLRAWLGTLPSMKSASAKALARTERG